MKPFTILQGIVYFAGIQVLYFFGMTILKSVNNPVLGLLLGVLFLCVMTIASAKLLEWVITR